MEVAEGARECEDDGVPAFELVELRSDWFDLVLRKKADLIPLGSFLVEFEAVVVAEGGSSEKLKDRPR